MGKFQNFFGTGGSSSGTWTFPWLEASNDEYTSSSSSCVY